MKHGKMILGELHADIPVIQGGMGVGISLSGLAGAVAAALAATLMIPSLAYADPTASEKQAEAQAALASLNSMQSTLNRTSVVYDEALAAQREAEAKRDEAQARIDEANGQIADLQTRLGSRARSMYRTGGSSFLDLLLGATTFQEFSTGWDMLNTLNENDADLVQQTKDLRAEVQEQQAAYAEQQRVAAEKADEALRSKQEAASTMSAMQATYLTHDRGPQNNIHLRERGKIG